MSAGRLRKLLSVLALGTLPAEDDCTNLCYGRKIPRSDQFLYRFSKKIVDYFLKMPPEQRKSPILSSFCKHPKQLPVLD